MVVYQYAIMLLTVFIMVAASVFFVVAAILDAIKEKKP